MHKIGGITLIDDDVSSLRKKEISCVSSQEHQLIPWFVDCFNVSNQELSYDIGCHNVFSSVFFYYFAESSEKSALFQYEWIHLIFTKYRPFRRIWITLDFFSALNCRWFFRTTRNSIPWLQRKFFSFVFAFAKTYSEKFTCVSGQELQLLQVRRVLQGYRNLVTSGFPEWPGWFLLWWSWWSWMRIYQCPGWLR